MLQLICENAASIAHGSYVSVKWRDIMENDSTDDRSPDEIALDVITRAGLVIGGGTK